MPFQRTFPGEPPSGGRAEVNSAVDLERIRQVQAARSLANAPANCPIRPAKGISRAAYRSPAFGLALSLSISTEAVKQP